MKTAFYIARRYLISKKSVNVINIISGISVAGVTVGAFALVVILSVFNGLDSSIKSLFSTFDPDLKIIAVKGKSFDISEGSFDLLKDIEGVNSITPVIEEDAMLSYSDRKYFATIKGVPTDYMDFSGFDSTSITSGKFILESDDLPFAVVGQGVAYYLSVGMNFSDQIHIYTLKKGVSSRTPLANTFNHNAIYASGIFANQQEIDSKYILVPFWYAKEVFEMDNRVSSVEVSLEEGFKDKKVKADIEKVLGKKFLVKTQYEQHEIFYKVMQSEKWAIFLILAFVLVIASFNILGSLSMLIIDKKDDIDILQSVGANQKLVKLIFLFEGWMISIAGAFFGIVSGITTCLIQIKFGILKIPGNEGSFIFSSYPVEIHLADIFLIFILVSGIGFLAAWYPIRFISGKYLSGTTK